MNGYVSYHLGADLGKEHDYTCVTFLRKRTPIDRFNRICGEPQLEVLTIKRFPLQTSYVQICDEIVNRLERPPFSSYINWRGDETPRRIPTYLAVDKTGTGAAVVDLLKTNEFLEYRLERLRAVNITAGREVNEKSESSNIPKRDLVVSVLICLEQENLKFAGNMPELPNLITELQNFELRHTAHGNQTFNAKPGSHDDMVLSLSLAVWSARNTEDGINEGEILAKLANWTGKGY